MKNEFVSVVSHELRTPLTSLRGALGLLQGGLLGDADPKAQRSRMLRFAFAQVRTGGTLVGAEGLEPPASSL